MRDDIKFTLPIILYDVIISYETILYEILYDEIKLDDPSCYMTKYNKQYDRIRIQYDRII